MLLNSQVESNSSTIKKCYYDFTSGTLKVEFAGGSLYEYANVSSDDYDNLCKAESQGKFFSEKIKNKYEFTKLLSD
jgi:hypothetical protein